MAGDIYSKLSSTIIRSGVSAEEAQDIVDRLVATDWEQVINQYWSTLRKRCNSCEKLHLLKNLTIVPGEDKLYCRQCCVLCPTCFKLRPSCFSASWLYPMCLVCRDKVDKEKLSRESSKVQSHVQRALKVNQRGTLMLGEWIGALEYFSWMCAYCQMRPYEHMDHFVPVARYGDTEQANCVPACRECNRLKGQTHPDRVTTIPQADLQRVREYLFRF